MKKTTLSLLAFCMYCTQNAPTNASEDKKQGDQNGYTPKYGTTSMTDDDHKQNLLSDFYPTDETSARHLDNALFGDFNPEERNDEKDEAEERQFALLKSRIMDYIPRIMEKLRLEDMAAKERGPGIIPQELPPSQKVPEIAVELKEPVNVQESENKVLQKEEAPQESRIKDQMVYDCAIVLRDKVQHYHTREQIAFLFMQHPKAIPEKWTMENCVRIANHLIDLDDL